MNTPPSFLPPLPGQLLATWMHCPWGIAVVDNAGKVIAVNPALVASTSLDTDSFLGMREADLAALLSPLSILHQRVEIATGEARAVHYVGNPVAGWEEAKRMTRLAEELREPLASIYGFAELLLTQNYDADMRHDLTATLIEQVEIMGNLINDRLDLTRNTGNG